MRNAGRKACKINETKMEFFPHPPEFFLACFPSTFDIPVWFRLVRVRLCETLPGRAVLSW